MCLIHFLIYHIIITIFYLIYSPYLLSIVADIATEGVGLLASIENSRGRRCCRRVSVARREGGVCCSDISKIVSKSRSTLTWNINDNESFKHTYLSLDVFLFICYRYTFIVFVFVLMTRLANSRLTGMLLITLFGSKNPLYLSTMFCETHLFSPETTRISKARWWRESRPSRTRRGRRGTRACRRGRRGWGGSGSGLARSSDTQLSNEAA